MSVKANHFDVVIVGAGPAGMACATTLGGRGLTVAVIDEQPSPGGQVWRNIESASNEPRAKDIWSELPLGLASVQAFRASGCTYLPQTQLWQIEAGWRLFTRSAAGPRILTADYLVLAVGAYERPLPFEGWEKPGVMTVGAAQILLKTSRVVPSGETYLVGSGPLVEFFAHQMRQLGHPAAGIIELGAKGPSVTAKMLRGAAADPKSLLKGASWLARQKLSGLKRLRATSLRALGAERLSGVEVTLADGTIRTLNCGALLVHDGLLPRSHEPSLALLSAKRAYRPVGPDRGDLEQTRLALAGDVGGIMGASAAHRQGRLVGIALAANLGRAKPDDMAERQKLDADLSREQRFRDFIDSYYPSTGEKLALTPETIICRCEEVSLGKLRACASQAADLDELKRLTRAGMGRCQGRNCASSVARLMPNLAQAPTYRTRPPLRPISLAEIAALDDEALS